MNLNTSFFYCCSLGHTYKEVYERNGQSTVERSWIMMKLILSFTLFLLVALCCSKIKNE